MKEEIKNHKKTWVFCIALATVVIIIYKIIDSVGFLSGAISRFLKIISPVLWGILLAYLIYIPERKIEKAFQKSKFRVFNKHFRKWGIVTTYLIVLLILIILINVIWPVLLESINEFISNFQNYYTRIIKLYNDLPSDSIFKNDKVYDALKEIQNIDLKQYFSFDSINGYIQGAYSIARSIFNIFVSFIVSVYILSEREQILKFIKRLIKISSKPNTYKFIEKYFNDSNKVFFRFIESQFVDAIIVGILASIVMKIMGVKYAILLGAIIGVFNMIPYFGAIIAIAFSGIITLMTGGVSKTIFMLIVVIILQQLDANIINPKIVGNSLKISPLLVIMAVTIGGAYFGVIGMFLSVPVVAVLKILLNDYIDSKEQIWYNKNSEQ